MTMKQDGHRHPAGAIVIRETADGARFLLVHRQGAWQLPVAVADSVERAVIAALAEARIAAAPFSRPTRLHDAWYEGSGKKDGAAAAGTGAIVFVMATVSRGEPGSRERASDLTADPVATEEGVSSRQACCWVTLDEGLERIADGHRGALVWAAARVMHETTLAQPESRQRLD